MTTRTTPAPPRFVTDESGRRVAVQIELLQYQELVEAWEELEALRAFDDARANGGESRPLEEAIADIERERAVP